MTSIPIFWILGLLLSVIIVVRALVGASYHSARSRAAVIAGRVLLVFGVAMGLVFLVRIIQWYAK